MEGGGRGSGRERGAGLRSGRRQGGHGGRLERLDERDDLKNSGEPVNSDGPSRNLTRAENTKPRDLEEVRLGRWS